MQRDLSTLIGASLTTLLCLVLLLIPECDDLGVVAIERAACSDAGGNWSEETRDCAPPPGWLSVHEAERVFFDFDTEVDGGCPPGISRSGRMTLTGVNNKTLRFADPAFGDGFPQPTAECAEGFDDFFRLASGGQPTAFLSWEEPGTLADQSTVVKLRQVDGSSPKYDPDTQTLTHLICEPSSGETALPQLTLNDSYEYLLTLFGLARPLDRAHVVVVVSTGEEE